MSPDWSRLAPNRPVDSNEAGYIPRPENSPRIADWIFTGRSPLLVVGPVGVGKSTELAFAAQATKEKRVTCLVPLDRLENMRTLSADRVFVRIAGQLASMATKELGLELSPKLLIQLTHHGSVKAPSLRGLASRAQPLNPEDLALLTIREIARIGGHGKVTLFIDGLEKTPPEPARVAFEALERISSEAELVVVVPWHAAYGPNAETVIVPGEKLISVLPVDVLGPSGDAGLDFLRRIAVRRLRLDEMPPGEMPPTFVSPGGVVHECAMYSGGIPRSFLQLLADAASYARLTDGEEWPSSMHVAQAVADQCESFRRLMLPGDDNALLRVDGTDGRDMPLEQKIRLLSHGLLLERVEGGRPVMRPHPIVENLLH